MFFLHCIAILFWLCKQVIVLCSHIRKDVSFTNLNFQLLCEILLEDIFGLGSEARQSPTTACPESRIVDAQYILSIMARVMTVSAKHFNKVNFKIKTD